MPIDSPGPITPRQRVNRREFLRHAGWSGVGATALVAAAGRRRASAESSSPYPDWIPPSPKPPKRGGMLTRASTWDPPVLDPRLTNSVVLFQFAALVGSRLVRYPFSDEATGTTDLTLKGDLAESWQGSPDQRVWTFKLRQGVRWHNAPPLNGRECVAADIKACYEAYAKEGVQAFTFREIEGMETPDKYTLRVHLNTPNVMFPQNVAEPIAVIFPREVLEEDGDLKKRMIGTGPFVLKEHTRKVRVALVRNPDYFDRGRPYVDAYDILSTPDATPAWRPSAPGRATSSGWRARPRWRPSGRPIPRPSCRSTRTSRRCSGSPSRRTSPPLTMSGCGVRSRWPSTARSRWTRCSRGTASPAGAFPISTTRTECRRRPSSAPGGNTARGMRKSSWRRRAIPPASRRRCSTTSTSRR